MEGTTISHYRVMELLGQGGMADVYKAVDQRLERLVALKFLRTGKRSNSTERLLREAQTVSKLEHPNICTIYEIGETTDGQCFIAMPYYDGDTLAERLERGVMPLEEALDVACQVARGLHAAHLRHIEHHDVKPANLIFSGDVVKILDFGIARLAEEGARGAVYGTLLYLAPERLEGRQGNARSDVWSLGVLLYQMINGQVPFPGDDIQAVLESIRRGRPTPPLEDTRVEAGYLEKVLDLALARRPEKRYPDVAGMLEDLENLVEQINAPRTGAVPVGAGVPVRSSELATARVRTVGQEPSIAILPFVDRSPERDQAHLCFGIAEELVRLLTSLGNLRVASLTSMPAENRELASLDREALGRLDVVHVLEGSVQLSGRRLRVMARLLRVEDRCSVWSQRYERTFEDVFEIQDEIAERIVLALEITLIGQMPSSRRVKQDPEAYNLLLKGRYHWNKRTEKDVEKGIRYFRDALERDPEYAQALAGLADSYAMQGLYSWRPPREVMPEARRAAERALSSDDGLAEIHASLASVRAVYEWDFKGAVRDFERAIDLDPAHATTRQWYAMNALLPLGRFTTAERQLSQARDLDPLSLPIAVSLGIFYYYRRLFDAAIKEFEEALEIDPGFVPAHFFLGHAWAVLGELSKALDAFHRAGAAGDRPEVLAGLGSTCAAMPISDKATEILAQLDEMSRERWVSPSLRAQILAAMGKPGAALEALGEAVEQRAADLVWLALNPVFDPLHEEPGFGEIVARVGLEAVTSQPRKNR